MLHGWHRIEHAVYLPNDITRTAVDHATFFKLRQQKTRIVEILCDFISSYNKIGQDRQLIVCISSKQT